MTTTATIPALHLESCSSTACELLIDPIPRPRPDELRVRLRPERDEVVLVDNGKPNSMLILRAAQRMLRDRGIEVKEEIVAKPSAGIPLEPDLLEHLAAEKGLVLLGVND